MALAVTAILSPGAAHAATCLDGYYKCLNDTYNTSGFERYAANFECGVEYIGCLRAKI
jgi:hypothetical protein